MTVPARTVSPSDALLGDVSHGRRRRRAGVALATVVGVGLSLLALGPAAAQTDDETPTTLRELPDGDITMTLIDQSFDVEPGADIELTYRLTGDLETLAELSPPTTTTTTTTSTTTTTTTTTTVPPTTVAGEPAPQTTPAPPPPASTTTTTTEPPPPPPPPVELDVQVTNHEPIDGLSTLERAVGPDIRSALLTPVIDGVLITDVRPMITVGEGEDAGTAILELSVPTDQDPSDADHLEFREIGLHPIVVELKVAGQVVANHGTIIERRDANDRTLPTIDLSLLTYIADPGPTGTAGQLFAGVEALDRTADVAEVLASPLTLSVPPNIARVASESSTSNNLPEALADDELIAAPATPFDVSSATAIDRVDAFIRQLTFGEEQLQAALPSTNVRRDAWLVTSPISAEAAAELRALSVRFIVMPETLFVESISDEVPATDRFIDIDIGDGNSMPVLVVDDLGESFTKEATDEILDELTATEWSIQTIARLRFEQYDASLSERGDERSRILGTPDLSAPDPRLLLELERLATTTDAIRFSPASELSGVTTRLPLDDDRSFPEAAGPSLTERLDLITFTQASLASVASMLPDDDDRFPQWSRQLDSFVSTAYDDDDVEVAISEIVAEAEEIRSAVIPPDPISFTLTGNEGSIDLRIGNRLDEPISVVLRLSSPRLTFPDGDRLITLPASASRVVEVPVIARTNGTSAVRVEILTPSCLDEDGPPCAQLIEPVTLKSRVNALTGLGQVLTAGLVLILLSWWFSNWRKKRRADADDGEDARAGSRSDDAMPAPDDASPSGQ
ncbi:hypothetical protein [Ilumatobacter coccineus]|uniref:Uncharacterized protein n=1 Tax=Ilumatobacter coccineus (strain NBRC 103263 / KCTC 29153 / YM16-304) TaxID=1313172 RepID=A0A6C7ECU5_ILUCY|nr:hypothetical protein [Ilumatobacter coccineus]BAN04587.1 hypothetical protein YM304_42730 [Ilumatobacter coccineus YM16-304]